MTDLRAIYQELILDHYRKPRNFVALESPTSQARGHNPLCGDRIEVYLMIDAAKIVQDVAFQGAGCAISTASASLMTEVVKGKTLAEARSLFDEFHEMMTGDTAAVPRDLGKLEALSSVRQIPIRVKCATLAWHTLKAALDEDSSQSPSISTES